VQAGQATFVELGLAPVLLEVALAQHEVAAEVARRQQGRCQHLRAVQAAAGLALAGRNRALMRQQIVQKAARCNGLFAPVKGRKGRLENPNLFPPRRADFFIFS